MPSNLDRREANDLAVKHFLQTWDPHWRWTFVLGLRDLRAHADRLGVLASEQTGQSEWVDAQYVFGPVALGLTAAAVNETAQHAEDLFALLKFIREPIHFAERITSYSAGQVVRFGRDLAGATDSQVRRLFMVPEAELVAEGLAAAEDPVAAKAAVAAGMDRLVTMTRQVANWYLINEFFHVQYKHGLKLPLSRPFGGPLPDATIAERRGTVKAPLIAFTNEPLSKTLQRPPSQQTVVIPNLGPAVRPHLAELIEARALLRYQFAGQDVDLDTVVELSWSISRLLKIARTNRLSLVNGLDTDRQQSFELPGPTTIETMTVSLELEKPVLLQQFQ
jgi:hypothetical protein